MSNLKRKRAQLRIIPLGGLGEIGLNMMVLEWKDSLIIIDAGLMFPDESMLGIDIVIPDFSYILERSGMAKGIILTHGHEDHIGALPFLLREIKLPVWGTPLTVGLVQEKLKEHDLTDNVEIHQIRPRERFKIGPFTIEPIRVSHSIVDGVGFAIKTPVGTIIHSGDFKLDPTPVDGELLDLSRFGEYGEKGVLMLLSDSTNVEKSGFSLSEREVGSALEEIFLTHPGRIIVGVFSSNIHRIQQVLDISARFGRKVALSGRSIVANVKIIPYIS